MEIIKCLEESVVIKRYEILAFEIFENGFYIKIKTSLIDGSELHIREYVDETERNYSYHWQDSNKNMIIRWDNSPYHKHIETYPHHFHNGNNVMPSFHISCKEILKVIENRLSYKKDR